MIGTLISLENKRKFSVRGIDSQNYSFVIYVSKE